jgi:hypothetical protein
MEAIDKRALRWMCAKMQDAPLPIAPDMLAQKLTGDSGKLLYHSMINADVLNTQFMINLVIMGATDKRLATYFNGMEQQIATYTDEDLLNGASLGRRAVARALVYFNGQSKNTNPRHIDKRLETLDTNGRQQVAQIAYINRIAGWMIPASAGGVIHGPDVGTSMRICANCDPSVDPLSGLVSDIKPLQVCTGCKMARYCSKSCQRAHWRRNHRAQCPVVAKMYDEIKNGDNSGGYDIDVALGALKIERDYTTTLNMKPFNFQYKYIAHEMTVENVATTFMRLYWTPVHHYLWANVFTQLQQSSK